MSLPTLRLRNLRLRNPGEPPRMVDIAFGEDFTAVGPAAEAAAAGPGPSFDLAGYAALPGLVNAHDHIPGNWYRKIHAAPYTNTYRWLETYRDLPEHAEKAAVWVLGVRTPDYEVNQDAMKRLGVFKNAISGATTVFDHFPRQAPAYYRGNGIRIVEEYRQTHSPRLGNIWGGDPPEVEWAEAGGRIPFVLHLAEGVDDEARGELQAWKAMGRLDRNLVVIHGVALTGPDLDDIAAAGASVVWCPDSNVTLLDAIMDLPRARKAGVRVALGTDTTVTGGLNMLEELRFAEAYTARFHGEPAAREELFAQATVTAAAVCGLAGRTGIVAPGASADLILMRDDAGADPLDRLFSATPRDLALVMAQGRPLVGDPLFEPLFKARGVAFTRLTLDGAEKLCWADVREPLAIVNRAKGSNDAWPMLFLADRHYDEIAPLCGPRRVRN